MKQSPRNTILGTLSRSTYFFASSYFYASGPSKVGGRLDVSRNDEKTIFLMALSGPILKSDT